MHEDVVRTVLVRFGGREIGAAEEARPSEVLVSGTTRDLAEGAAGLAFQPRGRHRLQDLEREHNPFAASASTG